MARLTKDALLEASDLKEREIELPSIGGSVKVRGLPAAYSNQATSEAMEMKMVGRDQIASVNTAKLEILQVLHGIVDPKLDTYEEAEHFAQRCGPSWRLVVDAIDELSGVDKEAIAQAEARFPSGGRNAPGPVVGDGAGAGGGGSDVRLRAGAGASDEPAGAG
jgi:hypothetical protein